MKFELIAVFGREMNLPVRVIPLAIFGNKEDAKGALLATIASSIRENPSTIFVFQQVENASEPIMRQLISYLSSENMQGVRKDKEGGIETPFNLSLAGTTAFLTTSSGSSFVVKEAYRGGVGFSKKSPTSSEEFRAVLVKDGLPMALVGGLKRLVAVPPPTGRAEIRAYLNKAAANVLAEIEGGDINVKEVIETVMLRHENDLSLEPSLIELEQMLRSAVGFKRLNKKAGCDSLAAMLAAGI